MHASWRITVRAVNADYTISYPYVSFYSSRYAITTVKWCPANSYSSRFKYDEQFARFDVLRSFRRNYK